MTPDNTPTTDSRDPGARVPLMVRVGPHRLPVVVDKSRHNELQVANDRATLGEWDSTTTEIVLSPDLAPDVMADTVLHEIMHACAYFAGLTGGSMPLEDEDAEELVVSALSTALLDVIRRNPDLVDYLRTEA